MKVLICLEIVGPPVFIGLLSEAGLKITSEYFWLLVGLYAIRGSYWIFKDRK